MRYLSHQNPYFWRRPIWETLVVEDHDGNIEFFVHADREDASDAAVINSLAFQ